MSAIALRKVTCKAMLRVPKEYPVHQAAHPPPAQAMIQPPAAGGEGFIRPAANERIAELVKANDDLFGPGPQGGHGLHLWPFQSG